ncbi:MAG: hypothetical protein H7A00_07840 [Hahellaceae bacterium]|nr:hypothetical protein [Hahellaceae bacterium]
MAEFVVFIALVAIIWQQLKGMSLSSSKAQPVKVKAKRLPEQDDRTRRY